VSFNLSLKKNPYSGLYLAIEGIDGSGKSTQLHALKDYFEQKERDVILTSEPKEDQITGQLIRKILSSQLAIPSSSWQYLYSADRVINHLNCIEPALKKGKTVISHRSFWSVVPYGIMDKTGSDYDYAVANSLFVSQGILSYYHQFIAPDITIYLNLPVEKAMKRLAGMAKEKDIYEQKEKLQNIAKGYSWLLQQFPDEFTVIDSQESVDIVTKKIIAKVEQFLIQ
jgi:dTMP kinase